MLAHWAPAWPLSPSRMGEKTGGAGEGKLLPWNEERQMIYQVPPQAKQTHLGELNLIYCQLAEIFNSQFRYWLLRNKRQALKHLGRGATFPSLFVRLRLTCRLASHQSPLMPALLVPMAQPASLSHLFCHVITTAGHTLSLQWGNKWGWGQDVVVSLCCSLFHTIFLCSDVGYPQAAVPSGLCLLYTQQHLLLLWPCYSLIPSVSSSVSPSNISYLFLNMLSQRCHHLCCWAQLCFTVGLCCGLLEWAVSSTGWPPSSSHRGPQHLALLPKPCHLHPVQQLSIFIISSADVYSAAVSIPGSASFSFLAPLRRVWLLKESQVALT